MIGWHRSAGTSNPALGGNTAYSASKPSSRPRRSLMSGGEPRRFNELLAAIPGLSDRLLTERLRELTEHEIVERVPAPDISPIAIQYRLTKSGRDLEVVVRAISAWAPP